MGDTEHSGGGVGRDDGGPAYPLKEPAMADSTGMTLRDYFAANAPSDVFDAEKWSVGECCEAIGLSDYKKYDWRKHWPLLRAALAYEYADAMLKARSA